MAATAELKLTAASELNFGSGAQAGTATATMPAVVGSRNYAQMAIITSSGATPVAARATLTWTKNGVVQTLGLQLPAAQQSPIVINFGNHPVEGDTNTAITLTVPTNNVTTEANLVGFIRVE